MIMKKIMSGTAAVLFTGITAMFLFGVNGNAYIDPSVMTYLIQAIAGVVIAVGAAVGERRYPAYKGYKGYESGIAPKILPERA